MTLALLPESLDNLVSTREAAEACGVGSSTVRKWAHLGYLSPTGLDNNNRPLYRLIDVLRCARDTRRRALGQGRTA